LCHGGVEKKTQHKKRDRKNNNFIKKIILRISRRAFAGFFDTFFVK
jgi:hypothetical protein